MKKWNDEEINSLQIQLIKYETLNTVPNWKQISLEVNKSALGAQRKARQMGFIESKPHKVWLESDKQNLQHLISNNTIRNKIQWKVILQYFPGQNSNSLYCYARRNQMTPINIMQRPNNQQILYQWDEQQREQLKKLVQNYTEQKIKINWNEVASHFLNFTQMECENAAKSFKIITYDQARWSEVEKQKLLEIVQYYRSKANFISLKQWEQISSCFVNRSAYSCKQQFQKINQILFVTNQPNYVQKVKNPKKLSTIQLNQLFNFIQIENFPINWKNIATKMKNYNPHKCRCIAHDNHFLMFKQYTLSEYSRIQFLTTLKRCIRYGKIQWGMVVAELKETNECKEIQSINKWVCKQVAVQNQLIMLRYPK